MKKLITFLIAVLFCSISFAKIWRVNNVAGVVADYTTVQAAHDNILTLDGDTLHLEPSITSYGNLIMIKRLTIISIGNFLSANPNLQYAVVTGTAANLNINNISASGSVFHCNFANGSISQANNLRFERCFFSNSLNISSSSSNIVMNCYITSSLTFVTSNSNVVSNNIIGLNLTVSSTASATITNNVICATGTIGLDIQNSIFQNNIINKGSTTSFVNTTNTNNLINTANLPAGNGNIINVNMTNVFKNPNGTNDTSFVLQTAVINPAAGAGAGGIDAGAYGGTGAFKPGLQAAIPSIYKIAAPIAPSGSTMNVIFSTRSNN